MKKMLCTIAMCVALVSGAFAQEAEASASKKGGFNYHNIKIEAAVLPKWRYHKVRAFPFILYNTLVSCRQIPAKIPTLKLCFFKSIIRA